METSKKIKEILVQLAIDGKLEGDITQLDESVFDCLFEIKGKAEKPPLELTLTKETEIDGAIWYRIKLPEGTSKFFSTENEAHIAYENLLILYKSKGNGNPIIETLKSEII